MISGIENFKSPISFSDCEVIANDAGRQRVAPAVTVLISLYNYSAYIESCLESVRASRSEGLPGGFEVLIVDDGSTDSSVAVVEKYLATHSLPIRLLIKRANSGVVDTRNIGLLAARAPLIFALDADNEIRPECLLAHYQAITASGCAMIYGWINRFDHVTRKSLGLMSNKEWEVRKLVSGPYIDTMAMFRKEPVIRLGGYSPEYGSFLPPWEDYDLWLKLAQAGYTGKMIPQVLSDYRVHGQSLVQRTRPMQRELAVYLSKKFRPLVELHDDLPTLFGTSRNELATLSGAGGWLPASPGKKKSKFIHRLLGRKICRSLGKRLAEISRWIYP
jgi:glycosyltransferase involved in cell wall biosynthesis